MINKRQDETRDSPLATILRIIFLEASIRVLETKPKGWALWGRVILTNNRTLGTPNRTCQAKGHLEPLSLLNKPCDTRWLSSATGSALLETVRSKLFCSFCLLAW